MPANILTPRTIDTRLLSRELEDSEACSMTASPVPIDFPSMETQNRLLLAEEQLMVDIEKPHHHDVLCGRGVTTNRHPGNESFRSLVSLNKELYVSSTKRQKMSISRSIVEAVRSLDPPGRFLEKDPNIGLWSDIGHKKAVEKTSQALRDGAASLRKQLSADMGDPDFLNAVFDVVDVDPEKEDARKKDKAIEKDKKKENEKENEADKAAGKEKENEDKEKVKASDKSKLSKTKSVPVKKGHRRVKSTPCSGTATTTKHHRRPKPSEQPPSPLARLHDNNPQLRLSPRSPAPRYSASQPNSPITWGGRITFGESQSPGSLGPIPPQSPYEHPSPSTCFPYRQASGHAPYSRSNTNDYHRHHPVEYRPPPHHSHPWSYGSSRYYPYPHPGHPPSGYPSSGHPQSGYPPSGHPPSGYPPSGHPPTPTHSNSPPPTSSPLPSGPLPPGRHQFSPSGYRSKPPPPEYRSKPPPPEWSPRMTHHQHHHSPRHYSPRHGDYPSGRSPRWRPPSPHDAYTPGYANSNGNSSIGLSVPALGEEGKYPMSALSPRVTLTPRSSRSSYGHTPPRPPSYAPQDFAPPRSPRYRRSGSNHSDSLSFRSSDRKEPAYRSSPVEEKKSEVEDKEDLAPYPLLPESSMPSASIKLKPRERTSSPPKRRIEEDEHRRSPGAFLREDPSEEKEEEMYPYDGTEDNPAMEDIAMSPIPFDHREDPVTLMELPEDIMTLPISPCGPNDDPAVAASRS